MCDGGPADGTQGRGVALGAGHAADEVAARDEQHRGRKIHADRSRIYVLLSISSHQSRAVPFSSVSILLLFHFELLKGKRR